MGLRDYSPKRRTAVVLAGSGSSGAYHAGVLKALDESGVRVDLLVGSGVGTLAAAFGAVAGGSHLYGPGGFWDGLSWGALYRLRPLMRIALVLMAVSVGVLLLPVILAAVAGLLFPLWLVVDLAAPSLAAEVPSFSWVPSAVRAPYLAALSVPLLLLAVIAVGVTVRAFSRDPRRFGESFESALDARWARDRLGDGLWAAAKGVSPVARPPSEAELGRRFVALLSENLGQPGFREIVLRAADLDAGSSLAFVLLQDAHRASYAAARARGPRSRLDGLPGAVDLRAPGYDTLLFDAVLSGLVTPLAAPVRRVAFPRGGLHAGEVHRLADGTLAGECGIKDALDAGAEQVIVVVAVPEQPALPARRRGLRAVGDAVVATLERHAVEAELGEIERMNRMIETLGHRTDGERRAWQDPATGREHAAFSLHVVRPARRPFGPLELDGGRDPATEVHEGLEDLMEQGYRDAYRLFLEPVVGAAPEPKPSTREAEPAVEL